MKANEFVKRSGWVGGAKDIIENRRSWTDKKSGRKLTDNSFVLQSKTYECAIGTLYMGNFSDYDENSYRDGEVNLLHLKRLVESWELVEKFGGLESAKIELKSVDYNSEKDFYDNLKQAILDVESCQ